MKILLVVLFAVLFASANSKSFKDHSVVELFVKSEILVKKVNEFITETKQSLDIWSYDGNLLAKTPLQALMAENQINSLKQHFSEEFKNNSIKIKYIKRNFQEVINKEQDANNLIMLLEKVAPKSVTLDDFHKRYHNTNEINSFLNQLATTYPRNTELFKRGRTVEGREIYGIRLFGDSDLGNFKKGKKGVVLNSGLHAREWIAPATVLYMVHQLLKDNAMKKNGVDKLLNTVNVHVLPNLNPDGYQFTFTNNRMWRKNRLRNRDGSFGVDLNRNFPWAFGGPGSSGVPRSDIYRGTRALSEVESQVLASYVEEYKSTLVVGIDYHSYGNWILRPWDYHRNASPDERELERIGAGVQTAIRSVNRQTFRNVRGAQMYVHSGGALDFYYGTSKIFGFCLELRGSSFVIAPSNIILSGRENYAGVLKFLEYAQSANLKK